MKTFWEAYDWVERTFWNSLTKKLMGFLFLFLINLIYLAVYLHVETDVQAAISSHKIAADVAKSILAPFGVGWNILLALTALSLTFNIIR